MTFDVVKLYNIWRHFKYPFYVPKMFLNYVLFFMLIMINAWRVLKYVSEVNIYMDYNKYEVDYDYRSLI